MAAYNGNRTSFVSVSWRGRRSVRCSRQRRTSRWEHENSIWRQCFDSRRRVVLIVYDLICIYVKKRGQGPLNTLLAHPRFLVLKEGGSSRCFLGPKSTMLSMLLFLAVCFRCRLCYFSGPHSCSYQMKTNRRVKGCHNKSCWCFVLDTGETSAKIVRNTERTWMDSPSCGHWRRRRRHKKRQAGGLHVRRELIVLGLRLTSCIDRTNSFCLIQAKKKSISRSRDERCWWIRIN